MVAQLLSILLRSSALIIALTFCLSAQADLQMSDEIAIGGVSRGGVLCAVTYQVFTDTQAKKMKLNLDFGDYKFSGLIAPFDVDPEKPLVFKDVVVDQGHGRYAAAIGAPITIAGLGVLDVEAKVWRKNGSDEPFVAKLTSKGIGPWWWWKKDFDCWTYQDY